MFDFQWHRFLNPYVIVAIVIMVIGMIILCLADFLNKKLKIREENKGKEYKDKKIIFKLTALALVFIGALTAIFIL